MSATEAAFLGFLFSGITALLAGVMLTRVHWRPDIPPYGLGTRFLDVTRHPERYVKDAPLGAIRGLVFVGGVLLAGAASVVAWEILQTMSR